MLFCEIGPHFERLRDVLTPRVIEFGYEPELAEALISVEAADDNWRSSLKLVNDDWGHPEEYVWGAAAVALDACAVLAEKLYSLVGDDHSHRLVTKSREAEDGC